MYYNVSFITIAGCLNIDGIGAMRIADSSSNCRLICSKWKKITSVVNNSFVFYIDLIVYVVTPMVSTTIWFTSKYINENISMNSCIVWCDATVSKFMETSNACDMNGE